LEFVKCFFQKTRENLRKLHKGEIVKNLFIINKFAGKSQSYNSVLSQLERLNLDNCTVKYTQGVGDATVIAREFVSNTDDFVNVFVCGGDGTINEVFNGIYDLKNCALAPVPTGSGNDFIRSFGVPKEDFLNIENLIKGKKIFIDLIKCNDKIGANSVTIGYDCAVAKNVEKFKRWKFITSSFAYKLSLIYCLVNKRKHNFDIYGDKKALPEIDNTYLLSVTAKGKYYGGGIKCAPLADNSDGYLDFMYIPTVGVLKFLSLLGLFIKGQHVDNPKLNIVYHNKFKEVEYRSNTPVEIGIDGEIFSVTKATISVIPKAVQLILPN
jgi:YegS/Rv2252/BmrU family lipid kinase